MQYTATTNGQIFEITDVENGTLINGEPFQWDISNLDNGHFHIIHKHQSYQAEVVKTDKPTKTFTFKINGKLHVVTVKDKFDLLLEKMGISNSNAGKINSIKAPMPGLIIDLKIKTGDTVKPGDTLLVLEAMKMENILKSPGEGTVKNVKVRKGDSVEKGQVLIEF